MADWQPTAELFGAYLLATGKSADTRRSYVSSVGIYAQWAEARECDIFTADRVIIERFIADQLSTVSRYTARNRLFALRCFYDWAIISGRRRGAPDAQPLPFSGLEGLGYENPTKGLKVKKPKTLPKPPIPLTDQRRLVFGAAVRSLRDEALLMTLIDSGMRIGEAAAMRIEQIRWGEGLIIIRGKGDKERTAWVGESTLALIREVIEGREIGPVWLTKEGKPITRDRIRKNFERLAKRTRVRAHPHRLRSTFANTFLQEGGDLGALQIAMGHSDISTTAQYAAATSGQRALSHVRNLNLANRLTQDIERKDR